LHGRWSQVVTADLGFRAVRALSQPRRGRDRGQKSMTGYKRMVEEMLAEVGAQLR
jgi:hypothetical protein